MKTTRNCENNGSEFSHVGSFLVLMLLATLGPIPIGGGDKISLTLLVLFSGVLVLIYKALLRNNYVFLWQRYKLEVSLFMLYLVLCLISLGINFFRFESFSTFSSRGLPFLVIQSFCLIFILLFLTPSKAPSTGGQCSSKLKNLGLVMALLFIVFVGVLQKYSSPVATMINNIFISGNIDTASNVRSIFAISTDFGAIAAMISIVFLHLSIRAVYESNSNKALIYITLLCLYLIAGVISGARIYILMFSAYVFALLIYSTKNRPILLILMGLLFIALLHLLFLFVPTHVVNKVGAFLPYLESVRLGFPISAGSFSIDFSGSFIGFDRLIIWERATQLIQENPWWGISNGGFRIYNESIGASFENNAHSFPLQILIDSGMLGLIVVVLLYISVLKRIRHNYSLMLFILAVSIGLLVDYFPDHSLPWIIIFCFCASVLHRTPLSVSTPNRITYNIKVVYSSLTFCIILIFGGIVLAWQNRLYSYSKQTLPEQISRLVTHTGRDYPIFLSQSVVDNLKGIRQYGAARFLYTIPGDTQHYNYPDAKLIDFVNDNEDSKYKADANDVRLVFKKLPGNERCCSFTVYKGIDTGLWVSNTYNVHNLVFTNNHIKLDIINQKVWSPLFEIEQEGSLSLDLSAKDKKNDKSLNSIILLGLYDGESGRPIFQRNISLTEKMTVDVPLQTVGQKVFIILRLMSLSKPGEVLIHRINFNKAQ
ncbi:O-antigen ligase family protein [Planctobacterium marinum]|uniref:O-antigen ligase family protein n=1 Tax=Planctobacterium marinum TaxID=1631968 RepID=UPI001E50B2D2|nr:O-antigen ligase family protein [Planctobacterium marinum]MCC2606141.1 O-antigen ligase family protein [Planctobacterium marinum]